MVNNIGGVSNTALAKASGSATSQKITGIGPVTHKSAEELISHQARKTATRWRWSNEDPKDAHTQSLVGLDQNLADNSKKSSDKFNTYNRDSPKVDTDYIRDLPPWMLEDPKGGMGNKTKDGK